MSVTIVPGRTQPPRPLTKRDLDLAIQRVVEDVAQGCLEGDPREGKEDLRPRWISPADLIRRVLPFTSRN